MHGIRGKWDKNQKQIVELLERAGASVQSLAWVGGGCPDLLVGYKNNNLLIEIKTEQGKLSAGQVKWHREWRGADVHIVRNFEEIVSLLREIANQT